MIDDAYEVQFSWQYEIPAPRFLPWPIQLKPCPFVGHGEFYPTSLVCPGCWRKQTCRLERRIAEHKRKEE
jgi:hypothetical protein